jgi:hypothetical protein
MDSVELDQFYKSRLLSDTIVRVQFASDPDHDKTDIQVHSIVLASSSQKFKLLLTDPQWVKKEGDKYLINIILDSPDQLYVFKSVLAYCYTGSLVIPESVSSVSMSDAERRLFWTNCAILADQQGVEKVVDAALNLIFFVCGYKENVPWDAVVLALKEPARNAFVKDSRVWDIVIFNVNKNNDKTDTALEMIVDVFGDLGLFEQKWRDVPLTKVSIIKSMSIDAFIALLNHPKTKTSEDLVAMMVSRKMLSQMLPEDDITKLLELVRWEHVTPQVASHIKNQVEPVEKYFENRMEKRQKLVAHKHTPSSVTDVVLSQHDVRGASRAYFHGCCIHLIVKSEKCIVASLEVFGLDKHTKINVGFSGTAWIELFGDSKRYWSKQLDGNKDVIWTEEEVNSGAFAFTVKVAITGFM